MSEQISFTERFVARADTPRRMARAFVRERHRSPALWILYLLVLLTFAALVLTGMDPSFGLGTRLVWAVVFALVPTAIVVAAVSVLAYVVTVRGARVRLFEGAVLESGFGAESFVLRNPVAESQISYRAIKSLRAHGEHVFLRQHGVAIISVYPRELFPDDALERVRSATPR